MQDSEIEIIAKNKNMSKVARQLAQEILDREKGGEKEEIEQKNIVNSKNDFEINLEQQNVRTLDEELAEIENKKLHLVEKFIEGDTNEKTQLTTEERKILPIIEVIARHPYSISEKLKYNKNHKFWINESHDTEKHDVPVLIEFLLKYYQHGISVDRAGRKEVVEIFSSMFKKEDKTILDERPKQSLLVK